VESFWLGFALKLDPMQDSDLSYYWESGSARSKTRSKTRSTDYKKITSCQTIKLQQLGHSSDKIKFRLYRCTTQYGSQLFAVRVPLCFSGATCFVTRREPHGMAKAYPLLHAGPRRRRRRCAGHTARRARKELVDQRQPEAPKPRCICALAAHEAVQSQVLTQQPPY
jgi:hypothetical protein